MYIHFILCTLLCIVCDVIACRIDSEGVIKVADFGLTEDVYTTSYYRQEMSKEGAEERVPIRWMAPESIENNIYDEKTDVVGTFILYV